MADTKLKSWRGTVAVGVFPLANIERHFWLEPMFTTNRGIFVPWETFDPYAFIFMWFPQADDLWIRDKSSMHNFEVQYEDWQLHRTGGKKIGPLMFHWSEPRPPIPSSVEFSVTVF
jgi:hypothetical protein